MNRLLSLSALLVCSSVYAQTGPFDLLEQKYGNHEISADTYIDQKYRYYFDRPTVNLSFFPDTTLDPPTCINPFLFEYAVLEDSLASQTRQKVVTELGGVFNTSYNNGIFRIHYDYTNPKLQTLAANGKPLFTELILQYMTETYHLYFDVMGFKRPVDDGTNGGDGYLNIFVDDDSHASNTDNPPDDQVLGKEISSIKIGSKVGADGRPTMDPETIGSWKTGDLKTTCAHELKHMAQAQYVLHTEQHRNEHLAEVCWMEGDAVAFADIVYPIGNDQFVYEAGYRNNLFNKPQISPNSPDEFSAGYGLWAFPLFIWENYENKSLNSQLPLSTKIWENFKIEYGLDLVDIDAYVAEINNNTDFSPFFTQFRLWTYFVDNRAVPGFGFIDAAIIPYKPPYTQLTSFTTYSETLGKYSTKFYRLIPGTQAPKGSKIRISNQNDGMGIANKTGSEVKTYYLGPNSYLDLDLGDELVICLTGLTGAVSQTLTFSISKSAGYNVTTFQNKIGTVNAGGSLKLDAESQTMPSGTVRSLPMGSSHTVETIDKTFTNHQGTGVNYNHHHWNLDQTLYPPQTGFSAPSFNQTIEQNAIYSPFYLAGFSASTDAGNSMTVLFQDPWTAQNQTTFSPVSGSHHVFLGEQKESNPNKPYYQIKSDPVIAGTGSASGLQFSFLNWSSTGTEPLVSAQYTAQPVVFTTAGASVSASYKAILASSIAGWVTGNQFVSENSTASVMYTSDGKLWLHRENGSDKKELLISSSAGSISGYSVAANGNNRYWVLNNGTTTPVCGHEINGVVGASAVPALTGLGSGSRIEILRVNSTSPKLALITKIGSTIYKSIGTLTAGAVTWGSWTSLTVGPNAIQVAGNGNLAYVTWIQGSSIFGYKLKTDGTWSSAKVIASSSSGSFASMAPAVDPNGNLNLILVRTNTQTGKKDLGEGAWYTTESTLPFTVLATSGAYGDYSAISLSCEGGKKLASVGVSTYVPNFSYYLWKHNGTEWIPETTAYGTTAQKLLQSEVDYRPSETAHASGLKLMTQTAVDWPPQSATKVTTGASETPVLSISGVQLTDTLIYSAHLDPSMVDSILIDTLGVWTVAVKGDGFVTETVNDLKLFGTSELVVNRDETGTRREIRFIPDLTKWDVWVVDPSGNKVRMNKSEAEKTGGEEIRELVAVYPNPFNPETRITVRLTETRELKVRVYNLVGQLVADLASGTYDRGDYAFRFDGRNLASGTYFYRVEIGNEVKTGKLQLLK